MEMNPLESAAVAAVGGVPAELLDAAGRLVITPHALTLEGQRNVPADLRPGESLGDFLERHVPGIRSGAWSVMISGAMVPQRMWGKTYPKHGQLIACRSTVGKSALQLVAIAVLSYFTMGMGGFAGGAFMGMTGAVGFAAAMGAFVAGSMLINKVLGPKVAKPGDTAAARQVYSLSSQRNSPRLYEPIGVLWGVMRVTPDLASKAYGWYSGDEQYMSTILLGGINVHSVADLAIGDTPIGDFNDVEVFYNGFSGMPSQDVPLYSNVDTVAGGELEDSGAWVTRTSSVDTISLGLDWEYQLFRQGDSGLKNAVLTLDAEYRAVGAADWIPMLTGAQYHNATADVRRVSYGLAVPRGQYEVRMRRREGPNDSKTTRTVQWSALRSVQPDAVDYSRFGRIGIKIKATGQISGSLDTLRATYYARPLPVWNGSEWITATTREEGLSNPGAIILQALRGVRDDQGRLMFGFGYTDEMIDIEGLKAFMLYCTAQGYTYDRWVTENISCGAFCEEVALAGMGQYSHVDGCRPTVVFVASAQPISGVVNMANMMKASFSVDYALSNTADGIEYQFVDRANNFETQTLRVAAPGVTTVLNPARVTGVGVTTEAHAAILARYHLAQSLYQYKTIGYQADIEHLDYRRLSVLSISHDLTQWGYGGRLVAADLLADGLVQLTLDEPVPAMAQAWVGLRVPGERDYRVFAVVPLEQASDQIVLAGAWPEDVEFPGCTLDNPAHDTLWCYDFKATPGYRVRVVSMEPERDLSGAKVTCVPEGPEFWDYVLNGTYVPAGNGSSIPQLGRPSVSNLRITEQVNMQGDTEWYELHALWDVEGDYDHAQVWAGRDGSELRLVDGNATGARSTFRIQGAGEWLVEVRPFNAGGQVGRGAQALYITQLADLPPRNPGTFVVQLVAGSMRRFAWAYGGDKPAALAGVQIRYLPGDVPLSVADWDTMQPVGEADDVYSAQFETTRPGAGLWTFGLRAINTAGLLANGIARVVIQLTEVFDQLQQPDPSPPPAVTGLAATAALASVIVSYDAPTYNQGHGHARTRIYVAKVVGSVLPEFDAAEQVAEGYAGPVSFGSEPATSWLIWAKHETVDGVLSEEPAGPVLATTGEDVAGLLEAIKGKLPAEAMTPALQQALDGAQTLAGSAELVRMLSGKAKQDDNDETLLDEITRSWENKAVIMEELGVHTDDLGRISAKWSVKMALSSGGQQVVGGVQMNGTAADGELPTLDFGVLTNHFYVAAPEGAGLADVKPFYVQTGSTTANGVVVPAGVYMDAAYINNVTVLWGRFGNLVADTIHATEISASQLTAGNGVIGGSLKSANYVDGSSGWILRPDGMAEFSGVIVRGVVHATSGTIGGITINGNGLSAGGFSGYAWPAGTGTGFHLGPLGLLLGNYSTGQYAQISAKGELYLPGLTSAGGKTTFTGEMTAGLIRSPDGLFVIDLNNKFITITV